MRFGVGSQFFFGIEVREGSHGRFHFGNSRRFAHGVSGFSFAEDED
jgi:hypothetical protein